MNEILATCHWPKLSDKYAVALHSAVEFIEKMELTGRIADQTMGTRGFFEWETPPDEVAK